MVRVQAYNVTHDKVVNYNVINNVHWYADDRIATLYKGIGLTESTNFNLEALGLKVYNIKAFKFR